MILTDDPTYKKIFVACAGGLITLGTAQFVASIWWASALTAGQQAQKEAMLEMKQDIKSLDDKMSLYTNVSLRVSTLETHVNDLEARLRDAESRKP